MNLYSDPRVNTDPVRPFVLPTLPRQAFPEPQGPFAVVSRDTHRIVGTCNKADREFWLNAGYIVG